jgi:cytochrome-b5 reductase
MKQKYENPRVITMEEVARHNSEVDAWTVVEGKVYNISPFLKLHPGGKKILRAAGIDGTDIFSKIIWSVY